MSTNLQAGIITTEYVLVETGGMLEIWRADPWNIESMPDLPLLEPLPFLDQPPPKLAPEEIEKLNRETKFKLLVAEQQRRKEARSSKPDA